MRKTFFTLLFAVIVAAVAWAGYDVVGDLDVTGKATVAGNVGIGSTVPARKLEVDGDIILGPYNTSVSSPTQFIAGNYNSSHSRPAIIFQGQNRWGGWGVADYTSGTHLRMGAVSSPSADWGAFGTYAGGFNLAVDGGVSIGTTSYAPLSGLIIAGNTGIGSVSPRQKLDVNGTVQATAFIGDGAQLTNLPAGGASGSTTQVQYNDAGAMAGASGLVYDKTTGNVGIGTTLPVAKLDTVGAGTTSATSNVILRNSAKTALVTVLDNGNVGIGSITPSAIITVPSLKATSGTRFLCIDTIGNVSSSASACSGT